MGQDKSIADLSYVGIGSQLSKTSGLSWESTFYYQIRKFNEK
jgi:hypothetical protein